MSDMEEISTKFECRKIGMRHTKDGHVFSLVIHPNDTPQELMQDFLGQRYMAVLVRMNDDDEPVGSENQQAGSQAIKLAGTLCRDEKFQSWLVLIGIAEKMNEESAADALRQHLMIGSRSELKTNGGARDKLMALRDEFIADIRSGNV